MFNRAEVRSVESFVIKAVRACSFHTPLGFWFGYDVQHLAMTMASGGVGACQGVTTIQVGRDKRVRVAFSLLSSGEAHKWGEGRITITFESKDSEFYCKKNADGRFTVMTMAVSRRRRALRVAIQATVDDLGRTSTALKGRLLKLGFTPNLEGLKQYVGEILAVEVEIEPPSSGTLPLFKISRGDDPVWQLEMIQLSAAARSFIAEQLASSH